MMIWAIVLLRGTIQVRIDAQAIELQTSPTEHDFSGDLTRRRKPLNHRCQQFLTAKGLSKKVFLAMPYGTLLGGDRVIPGHENDRFETIDVRHSDVGDQTIDLCER
jgi:hypothetical protein